jgi:hypothetical protein
MSSSSMPDAIEIFNSKEKLEEAASLISIKAPDGLRQSTYLYFLARYLVIFYEANFAEVPVQVWNEYRNALDHYFRSITGENEASKHLTKMEGHLQRAVLDICKLSCHKTEGRFAQALASENKDALRLVDNGEFYSHLIEMFNEAKETFVSAKACDLRLGDGANMDREIVGKYLQALYSYRYAELFLENRRAKILTAEQQVRAIQHQGSKHHIRDSLIAKALWYGPVAGLFTLAGIFGHKYWPPFKSFLISIKSAFID